MPPAPVRVVVVNDFEVVVLGLARLLAPYSDRIEVVELNAGTPAATGCDIALYDTFGAVQGQEMRCEDLLRDHRADKVVVYTWNLDAALVQAALSSGVDGYLSKELDGGRLISALERIHAGEHVVTPEPASGSIVEPEGGDWPGRREGLTEREAEVLAYIVQGLANQELADRAYISVDTVKSAIRRAYRKMGVKTRSQAILWGIDHGFRPEPVRITPRDATS